MLSYFKLINSALLLLLLFSFSSNSKAQSDIYVDRNGSAAPDGTAEKPYQLVKAGACRARLNGTIVIRPGVYNETFTLNRPVKLTASGPAVIGQVADKRHTTLKVVTYNTHLFGAAAFGITPTFADMARAEYIAESIKGEGADVVGLQEVWDVALAAAIIQRAGYQYYFYDNKREDIYDVLNSGLLLLSKHLISNVTEKFYIDEVSPGAPIKTVVAESQWAFGSQPSTK